MVTNHNDRQRTREQEEAFVLMTHQLGWEVSLGLLLAESRKCAAVAHQEKESILHSGWVRVAGQLDKARHEAGHLGI